MLLGIQVPSFTWPEGPARLGPTFKRILSQAMREAYGVTIPTPRATLHGPYAEALERLL